MGKPDLALYLATVKAPEGLGKLLVLLFTFMVLSMSPQVTGKNLQETALLKLTLELKVTRPAPKIIGQRGEEMRRRVISQT